MTTGTVTADGRARVLADGNEIPLLGLGVWQVPPGPDTENSVRWALELGYRHVDTAQAYGNEESVGRALRDSGVPREEVFITTKFFPGRKDPEAEARRSLERLGVDHVDLYIIHWPQGGPTWAWPGMEGARERGYARSIGVSNFSVSELDELMSVARTAPVVNQVQFSPFEYRRKLLEACVQRGVALEAYSPLGTGRHLSDEACAPDRGARRADAGPGPSALVRAAGSRGHPEVDASRPNRGERPDLRLRAARGGHGRTRRARSNGRHRRRPRAPLVVMLP